MTFEISFQGPKGKYAGGLLGERFGPAPPSFVPTTNRGVLQKSPVPGTTSFSNLGQGERATAFALFGDSIGPVVGGIDKFTKKKEGKQRRPPRLAGKSRAGRPPALKAPRLFKVQARKPRKLSGVMGRLSLSSEVKWR